MTTTEHRGDPGKNNVYGTGLVQAFAAVLGRRGIGRASTLPFDRRQRCRQRRPDARPGRAVSRCRSRWRAGPTADRGPRGDPVHRDAGRHDPQPARDLPHRSRARHAASNAPHFSLTIDPEACTHGHRVRSGAAVRRRVRRSTFHVRVGEPETVTLLARRLRVDLGWTSDPGGTTQGGSGSARTRSACWTAQLGLEQSRGRHLRSRRHLLGHRQRRAEGQEGREQQRRRRTVR